MSVLGEVKFPMSWERVRLGAVAHRVSERGFADLDPLSVCLGDGVVPRADRKDNRKQLGGDLGIYQRVLRGDLVFNKLSTWQGAFGVSRHIGIVSPAYIIARPSVRVLPQFLHHYMRSEPVLAELTRLSKWMPPSQFDINWDDIRGVTVALPPLEEQRRIADFLDDQVARIDTLVELRRSQRDAVRDSILVMAHGELAGVSSVGQRRRSSIPWIDFIPRNWGTPRVSQVARMGTGHTPSRSEAAYWVDCDIPWLTTGDVHRFRHDEIDDIRDTVLKISQIGLDNSAAVIHPRDTVALSRTASAGFSIIMREEMATSQDFATWTPGANLDSAFLLWCLRAMRPDLLGRLAMGSTHKTIYFPDLGSIRIPLPPLAEQRRIGRRIQQAADVARAAVSNMERAIDLIGEYKRSLITAAVMGELDVTTARRGAPA